MICRYFIVAILVRRNILNNASERNKYIKCEETLNTFSPPKDTSKNLSLTAKLIEQIQEKGINVFEATGAFKGAKENAAK